jgi:hypothetical protein
MSNQEQTPRPGQGSTSSTAGGARQPSEEEMQAALEAELKRLTVNDVLLQALVSLLNLGGRKLGSAPGTEAERDLAQVQAAIEGVRALLPVVERSGAAADEDLGPARDVLAQLQMAYAKLSGEAAAAPGAGPPDQPGPPGQEDQPESGKPGPAQSSGRLWIPGEG